ncbi:hypothetical protein ANCCAN_12215 [Ancylostoma caninum]|uniref:AICARFT/IMPCHase bienzyme n=1 Tax=Ancylostoma caninum TaxID=29170 RepID=A0A368GBR4_ANCCA|nr:hypothetical protein ANCCAN_12215 [Ancylostoma caninum]
MSTPNQIVSCNPVAKHVINNTTKYDVLQYFHLNRFFFRWLRQHPLVLSLPWKPTVRRAERSNAIDVLCSGVLGDEVSLDQWQQCFTEPVNPLTPEDRKSWLAQQTGVVMSSDAFLPFRDNIDCAKQFGVMFVAHPGGSVRDDEIIEACDGYGITLIHTGLRLFHH